MVTSPRTKFSRTSASQLCGRGYTSTYALYVHALIDLNGAHMPSIVAWPCMTELGASAWIDPRLCFCVPSAEWMWPALALAE